LLAKPELLLLELEPPSPEPPPLQAANARAREGRITVRRFNGFMRDLTNGWADGGGVSPSSEKAQEEK
jgi:hypothetical protein